MVGKSCPYCRDLLLTVLTLLIMDPLCRSVVAMAQPNKKGPVKTVGVNCAGCGFKLYKYRKVSILFMVSLLVC